MFLQWIEYFMEFGTSFSKLKIMRTAITYSIKKCGVLVDQCLRDTSATGPMHGMTVKKKCPTFILPDFCNILYMLHTMYNKFTVNLVTDVTLLTPTNVFTYEEWISILTLINVMDLRCNYEIENRHPSDNQMIPGSYPVTPRKVMNTQVKS